MHKHTYNQNSHGTEINLIPHHLKLKYSDIHTKTRVSWRRNSKSHDSTGQKKEKHKLGAYLHREEVREKEQCAKY